MTKFVEKFLTFDIIFDEKELEGLKDIFEKDRKNIDINDKNNIFINYKRKKIYEK